MHGVSIGSALLCLTVCAVAQEAPLELRGTVDIAVLKEGEGDWKVDTDRETGYEVVSRAQLPAGWTMAAVASIRAATRFSASGVAARSTEADGTLTFDGPAGRLRLGRAYTAAQDLLFDFEPFEFRTVGTLLGITGNYVSDPEYGGAAGFQFKRAVHYRSPSFGGWQAAASLSEPAALSTKGRRPWSATLGFDAARWRAMVGWERGTNEDRFDNASVSLELGSIRWMATGGIYRPANGAEVQRSWVVGGVVSLSEAGSLRFGYGGVDRAGGVPSVQRALGVWWKLAESVSLYADFSSFPSRRSIDLGLRYKFSSSRAGG